MNNIQIGLDIATSLSVIGATILFLKSLITQNKKNRALAIGRQRIENMSSIVIDFTKLIEKGEIIVQEVRAMQSGREGTITADTYTNYCYDLMRYIKINLQLRFQVWATLEEIQIFQAVENHIRAWNDDFVKAAINKDYKSIPSFDKLVDNLSGQVLKLSRILRQEIEKINA